MTDINSAADVPIPTAPQMSKSEREDLQRLVRQRERVLKSAAKQRSTELLADFENQMGQQYSFDQDEIWERATEVAEREVAKAQKQVEARCRELGIPDQFAPSLNLAWHARGYGNALEKRRAELRRMAQTRIAAIEQAAIVKIEMTCLDAQTSLAIASLTSDAARQFIEQLPSPEKLMPALSFAEVADETNPPVAEQLVSPNALRQRRYRERHRNATVTHVRNADDGTAAETPVAENDPGPMPDFLRRDRGASS
jgi:hypothetical protein